MSNQEAIALLRNLEDSLDSYCELSEEGKTAFRMAIEALSSSEFPNSSDTDAISRQAAIEALAKFVPYAICDESTESYTNGLTDAYNLILQLPSAQPKLLQPWEVLVAQAVLPQSAEPKRGKWILDRSGAYCCSECMEPCAGYVMMKPRDKFCKMCGSRNEVTE